MPDIAMCVNKSCHMREQCYRFRATPSERQAYADFRPGPEGGCLHFSPVSPAEARIFDDRDAAEAILQTPGTI